MGDEGLKRGLSVDGCAVDLDDPARPGAALVLAGRKKCVAVDLDVKVRGRLQEETVVGGVGQIAGGVAGVRDLGR